MANKKTKCFGKHIKAFHGHVNGGPLRPYVGVAPNDDVEFGEWLSLRQAESLAKNILKAVAHLRKDAVAKGENSEIVP